jgi:hypothetical protein
MDRDDLTRAVEEDRADARLLPLPNEVGRRRLFAENMR